MKSNNITVTDGRLLRAWKTVNKATEENTISEKIKEAVDESKIKTGTVTCFFPWLDKCRVKLDDSDEYKICKILHRCWGGMVDFYTPQGEASLDEELKEPCVLPLEQSPCLIVDIDDKSSEWLLLGYYNAYGSMFNKPADEGEWKLANIGATDTFYLKFGNSKFEVATSNGVSITEKTGTESNELEYYTKSEVDELLDNLREELTKEVS